MQKWQYYWFWESFDEEGQTRAAEEANRLGEEGWEMISASGSVGYTGHTDSIYFCFKRPKD
jgi:hypothetical protein